MGRWIVTKNGYELLVVSSALQKAIRRNEPRLAGWAIIELFESGFVNYAWKRLLVISAEDCDGVITGEIESLMRAQALVQKTAKKGRPAGFIFLAKATLLLCGQAKNRDPDHLGFLAKQGMLATDQEVLSYMNAVKAEGAGEIPDYVYDVHTRQGRTRGKTKQQFWAEEQAGLRPKAPGLFDELMKEALSNAQDDPPN